MSPLPKDSVEEPDHEDPVEAPAEVPAPVSVGSPVDPAEPKVEVPDPAPIPEPVPEPEPAPKPVSVPFDINVIANPFGYRYGVNPLLPADVPELHNGIDFAAPMDTPIRSVKSGTVEQVFMHQYGGLRTVVQHDDGSYATYSHQNNQWVTPGQHVERGEVIGAVGTTGNSTGPHLHFEYGENGVDVDPAPVFDDF